MVVFKDHSLYLVISILAHLAQFVILVIPLPAHLAHSVILAIFMLAHLLPLMIHPDWSVKRLVARRPAISAAALKPPMWTFHDTKCREYRF
jgi:hypothetical protein